MLREHGDWLVLGGRCGMCLPPLLEALGLVELERNPRNNRVRVI